MKIQSLEEMAQKKLGASLVKSVVDLPDFPYATYAEFVKANADEKVLVWNRVGIDTCWKISTLAQRIWLCAFIGIGPLLAVGLVLVGFAWHDFWFVLAVPCAAIGLFNASPNLGCFNLFVPALCVCISGTATLFTGNPYFFIGGASIVSCVATSASLGVFDMTMRREMVSSEPIFLWLWKQGYVSDVIVKKDTPNDASEKKIVWPPPPKAATKDD